MEVNCEGCAGCCLDWRPLGEAERATSAHEGRSRRMWGSLGDQAARRDPLDDDVNFVPLARDEVRAFLEAGLAAALTPRFWHAAPEDEAVEVDGRRLAAIAGRPVFFVGLRKPPKPVAPFGREEAAWLPACVFLDPRTLQCRIHDDDLFPDECGAYPRHTLALDAETECERVESIFGGDRLLDSAVDADDAPPLGLQAIGSTLFCHPDPDRLEGSVGRLAAGEATREDRARCLAVAAASSPGTLAISEPHRERARKRALADDEDAWAGPAIREWHRRAADDGEGTTPSPAIAASIEEARGAPETPGWDALDG